MNRFLKDIADPEWSHLLSDHLGCPTPNCSNRGTETVWLRGVSRDGKQTFVTYCPACQRVGQVLDDTNCSWFYAAAAWQAERDRRLNFPRVKLAPELAPKLEDS